MITFDGTNAAPDAERERAERCRESVGRDGRLTEKGRDYVKWWAEGTLIFDSTAELLISDVVDAFEKSDEDGFDIPYASMTTDFRDAVIAGVGVEELVSDAYRLRARFRDELGGQRFSKQYAPTKVDYLVEGFLPLRGVNMFVALPETLKTWTAYDIAVHVSKGAPWLGRATRKGRGVIVSYEMDPHEPHRRLQLLGAEDDTIEVVSYPPFMLHDPRFWRELAKLQPNFVIIDSLSAGSGETGELDSRFAEPLRHAAKFVAKHGAEIPHGRSRFCSFLFLHHSPKNASSKDAESLFRGTGAVRGAVDHAYYFERVSGRETPSARISSVKTRNGSSACAPFTVSLSDDRGLALADERRATSKARPPRTDAERLFAFIAAHPGTSSNAAREALHMRKEDVGAARRELGARIRVEGKGRATKLYAVPDPVPTNALGTDCAEPNANTFEKTDFVQQ